MRMTIATNFHPAILVAIFVLQAAFGNTVSSKKKDVLAQPPKENFCQKYTDCRVTARRQFENCTQGNIVTMILAKSGTIRRLEHQLEEQLQRNDQSQQLNATKFVLKDNICLKKLDEVVGKKMRELYDHAENQTLHCAMEVSKTAVFQLDETQTILCRAISQEIAGITANDTVYIHGTEESAIPYGAESENDCAQIYESEIRRCELTAPCCLQHERCQKQIDGSSGIHLREMILIRSFDECIQNTILNSHNTGSVNYTKIRDKLGNEEILKIPKVKEMIAAVLAESENTGISLRDVHPKIRAAVYTRLMRLRALQKKSDEKDIRFHPKEKSTTTSTPTSTLFPTLPTLPEPHKALKNLVDLLFPGLNQSSTTIITTTAPSTTATIKENTTTTATIDSSKTVKKSVKIHVENAKRIEDGTQGAYEEPAKASTESNDIESVEDNEGAILDVATRKERRWRVEMREKMERELMKSRASDTFSATYKKQTNNKENETDEVKNEKGSIKERKPEKTNKNEGEKVSKENKEKGKNVEGSKHGSNGEENVKRSDSEEEKLRNSNEKQQNEPPVESKAASEKDFAKDESNTTEKTNKYAEKKENSATKKNSVAKKEKSTENLSDRKFLPAPPSPWSVHSSSLSVVSNVSDNDLLTKTKTHDVLQYTSSENSTTPPLIHSKSTEQIFCAQYFECREVLHDQYNSCEEKFLEEDKKHGIADRLLRAAFEENSGVNDAQIQLKCYKSIDAGSQNHLIALREKIKQEMRDCTHGGQAGTIAGDEVHFNAEKISFCENIKPLSALSAATKIDDTSATSGKEGFRRCNDKLAKLEQKCNELRDCCPANLKCEQLNTSGNARQYAEIIEQLKQEQNLCERRHLRLRNGLM